MEKLILKLTIIILSFLSTIVSAQEFQAKAYYQTQRKIEMKLDDSNMSESQKQEMQTMLKKQFEKTFILTFNKDMSIYKEEERLEPPSAISSSGNKVMVLGGGSNAKYFKNIKSKSYIDQQDMFGKQFLIKDSLEDLNWKLEEETKVIGKYLCFKATAIKKETRMELSFSSESKEKQEPKEIVEEHEIVAWYTSDIPVSSGPSEYGGLPGLILELNAEEMQYVCSKIVMNTNEKIEEPKSGKEVTSKEYQKIMEKKMSEMRERYSGREHKGDGGQSFQIRIGG